MRRNLGDGPAERVTAREIALDPEQARLEGLKLQPGMPAEVMIVTGERAPLDYLWKPLVTSFGRALREE